MLLFSKSYAVFGFISYTLLLHDPQVLRHLEWCLSLGLDLVHCYTLGVFDQSQAGGEVDVKDGLYKC